MWCDIYSPKTLQEFNTNRDIVDRAKEWVESISTVKKCKPLLIIGPVGSGKTLLAQLILDKYNYDIHEFNSGDVRSQKNIKLNLENILNCRPLFNNKQFAIIIDELESINSDRGGITQLQSMINPKNNKNRIPIICICAENEDKKFVDLKRNCEVVVLKRPNRYECRKIIDKICKTTDNVLDDDTIDNIIRESEYDIRKCINYLEDICKNIKKHQQDDSGSLLKSELYGKKDNINLNNYDIVYKILNDNDINLDLIMSDPMIIPMILHENYIKHIIYNYKDNDIIKLLNITKIAHMYSYTNSIDRYIIANNVWDINNISKTIKHLNIYDTIQNGLKCKNTFNNSKLIFTRLLTNSSNSCNNYKSKVEFADKIKINISTIHIIEDFIYVLIHNKKSQLIKNFMNTYNIDLSEIIKIYKNNKSINESETEIEKENLKYIKGLLE